MTGLGRQLEENGGADERVARLLDAIQFQTAILMLNAAVDAAHDAAPELGSAAPASQAPHAAGYIAGRAAADGRMPLAARSQAADVPPIAPNGESTYSPVCNCCPSAAESAVEVRRWQESLERLGQALGVASGTVLLEDNGGRHQTENTPPRPAAAPGSVPVQVRLRRSQPPQFGSPDLSDRGANGS
jgi:hypothetical protein